MGRQIRLATAVWIVLLGIVPQAIAQTPSLVVAPGNSIVAVGGRIRFVSLLLPQLSLPSAQDMIWVVTGGIGKVEPDGTFTAMTAGRGSVVVTHIAGARAEIAVFVTDRPVVKARVIAPSTASLGQTLSLQVLMGFDDGREVESPLGGIQQDPRRGFVLLDGKTIELVRPGPVDFKANIPYRGPAPQAESVTTIVGAGPTGRVTGVVTWRLRNGTNMAQAGKEIYLVSRNAMSARNGIVTVSDGTGRFSIEGVAPGNYRVYATQDGGRGEWLLPVRVFAGEATEVALTFDSAMPIRFYYLLPAVP